MMRTYPWTTEINIDGSAHSTLKIERRTNNQIIFADTTENNAAISAYIYNDSPAGSQLC